MIHFLKIHVAVFIPSAQMLMDQWWELNCNVVSVGTVLNRIKVERREAAGGGGSVPEHLL